MAKLNLGELLRYVLAGAVGLFAALLISHERDQILCRIKDVGDFGVLFAILLSFGALVYAVHRAVLYPMVYRLALWVVVPMKGRHRGWRFYVPLIPADLDMSLDFARWRRAEQKHFAQAGLSEWGAQIHFLYCSVWAVFWAILCLSLLRWQFDGNKSTLLRGAGGLLIVTFIGHCRLVLYDWKLAGQQDGRLT